LIIPTRKIEKRYALNIHRGSGKESPVRLEDILTVAPYNLQVDLLKQLLPQGTQVGTVDKFQGKEAVVVIVSMTTSKGVEAPRGTEFLFNPNRFNVAVSRAQCLALVVHGAELLEGAWTTIDDLHRLNLFAHAETVALRQP
jgi:superfamily I DNA and/or RNA helicase